MGRNKIKEDDIEEYFKIIRKITELRWRFGWNGTMKIAKNLKKKYPIELLLFTLIFGIRFVGKDKVLHKKVKNFVDNLIQDLFYIWDE